MVKSEKLCYNKSGRGFKNLSVRRQYPRGACLAGWPFNLLKTFGSYETF
jgi:hypothetical protein